MAFHVMGLQIISSAPINGAEAYCPAAKLGNLKDVAKIKEKEEEHSRRWLESLATDPLFALPLQVRIAISDVSSVSLTIKMYELPCMIREGKFLGDFHNFVYESKISPDLIVGPHPQTDSQILYTAFLRQSMPIPKLLSPTIRRFNPWRECGIDLEAYSPGRASKILGLPGDNLASDSIRLALPFVGMFEVKS